MPEGLPEAAQAEWRRVVDLLRERGALNALDRGALVAYATAWAGFEAAKRDIAIRGVLVDGGGGRGTVKNPSAQILRQFDASLLKWARELGLTPMAREKVKMRAPVDEHDPWAELAAERV